MAGAETLAAIAVLVLAQAAPTVTQEVVPWVQVAGTSTIGGLLVYLITVYLPRRDDKIAEELKAARLDYLKQSQEERALYRETGKAERDECERRHKEILERLLAAHDAAREANHGVKNLLQIEANKRAADELRGARQARENPP